MRPEFSVSEQIRVALENTLKVSLKLRHTGKQFFIFTKDDWQVFEAADFLYDFEIQEQGENSADIFSQDQRNFLQPESAVSAVAQSDEDLAAEAAEKNKQGEICRLAARLMVWQKIHTEFEADPEFIANAGMNRSRFKKSAGHVLVEGFLKNFGVLLFAALTTSFFDGDLSSKDPEHYSALNWPMWAGLFSFVCAISLYTIPNQYYYATRTISELDEEEMNPLYYHPHIIEERLSELLSEGKGSLMAFNPSNGSIVAKNEYTSPFKSAADNDRTECVLTTATVAVAEASDALCVAMVLFLLKFRGLGLSEKTSYILTLTLIGVLGAGLKSAAAVSNYTGQAQNHRQALEYFKTGKIIPVYEQYIPLLSTEERQLRVYKVLYIGLPLLFGLVHAGAAFKLELMQEAPMAVKTMVGILLSLGAFAKTGTYDLSRTASAMGLENDQATRPYKSAALNAVGYFVSAQSPRIYDHWMKRSFLLGPSYYLGLAALMFKALEACMDGVIAPYTDVLNTKVAGIEIKYSIAFVIAAWGALTQTLQGVKAFHEKALQAETAKQGTANESLLGGRVAAFPDSSDDDMSEVSSEGPYDGDSRLCCCV